MNVLMVLILCAVFLFVALLVVVIFKAWGESRFAEKQTVKKRLLFLSAGGGHGKEKLERYRNQMLKDVGAFEQLAMKMPRIHALDRMLVKTKVPYDATGFFVISLGCGLAGFFAGYVFLDRLSAAVALGIGLLCAPLVWLKIAENSYYDKFQEQLPEALDLLGRALRSGNSLTSGLDMISQEMEEPIRTEFATTVDEIKLGLTVQEAFDNMCERVASTDLRFFAVAVTIQKETGGNLAEILDNISRLIRERVQFRRQVRTLTAEGRLSAAVLISLPIVMFLYIFFVNYQYISLLWTDKLGLLLLVGGIVSQIIGALVIKRIVSIEI